MRKALFFALLFVASITVASATDRTIWYPQQTPTSTGLNQQARNDRLALGTWLMQALNLTSGIGTGIYSNLTTSAATGLYVTTTPTVAVSLGALYQVQQNDAPMPTACPTAVSACPQLTADPTLIVVPGFQAGSSGPIGPLTAPVTSGQSVYWLVEAQVNPSVDTNSTNSQFVISGGPGGAYIPQNYPVNIKRTDQVVYQTKAGTPGTSPTEPSVDSGWIAIAYVLVPYATTQITSGMIYPATPFTGFGGGSTVVAGNCISAVPTASPAGGVAINYTCATPPALPLSIANGGTGTAAPAPTGTNGCTVGTFPSLVVSCPTSGPQSTPSPTASTGISISGVYPYTIAANISAAACPVCYIKSSSSTWLAYVQTLTNVTHIWPMSDAAGCNSIADAVGGGATALPSPVPLATPMTNPSPNTCGAPSISNDGNTSVNFTGSSNASYFTVPSGALPGVGSSWSFCGAVKTGLYGANVTANGTHAVLWGFQASTTNNSLVYFSSGTLVTNWNGVNNSAIYDPGNAGEYVCETYTPTGPSSSFYVNGTLFQTGSPATLNAANGMAIGNFVAFENWPMIGRMCCFVLANGVFTQAQIQAMTAALGY